MTRRFRHGELHLALLALLLHRPMHGYELMGRLETKLGGHRPSPGSIYPAIASLESEGLIEAEESDGRRVYRVTPVGVDAFAKRADRLATLEERLGVRFLADDFELALAEFGKRARAVHGRVSDETFAAVLDRTARELETMAQPDEGE